MSQLDWVTERRTLETEIASLKEQLAHEAVDRVHLAVAVEQLQVQLNKVTTRRDRARQVHRDRKDLLKTHQQILGRVMADKLALKDMLASIISAYEHDVLGTAPEKFIQLLDAAKVMVHTMDIPRKDAP